MTSFEPFHAMLAALAVFAILNLVLMVRVGLQGLRSWRTVRAAQALVDVHLGVVEARAADAIGRTGALEQKGQALTTAGSGFSASLRELTYLLSRVPEEQARLKRALLDLVLPTDAEPRPS